MKLVQRTLAIAAVVLVGGAAGFSAYRSTHLTAAGLSTASPAPPSPAADLPADPPASPPAITPRPVPEAVPDVRLPDLAGTRKSLRSFEGRPLIINFWATWCPPCRREIPLLQQLRRTHAAQHLEIVGIAVDFQQAVVEYLKKTAIDYPLLVGEQDGLAAVQQFGMQVVLPFSVFVASDGRIVAVKIGELHADESEFILSAIQRVDRGTQGLPQARAAIAQRLKQLSVARAEQGR